MTLLHSPPQLDTPWRDLITAAVAAVILPSGLGMALLAVFSLFGGVFATEWNIGLWAAGMALMLSPFGLVVPVDRPASRRQQEVPARWSTQTMHRPSV